MNMYEEHAHEKDLVFYPAIMVALSMDSLARVFMSCSETVAAEKITETMEIMLRDLLSECMYEHVLAEALIRGYSASERARIVRQIVREDEFKNGLMESSAKTRQAIGDYLRMIREG